MRRSFVLATLASVMIPAPGFAQSTDAADKPVLALIEAFSDARAKADAKALDTLLTPDYVEVSPRGQVDRRPEVLGFYAPEKASPAPPMTLATQEVRRHGDTAIVIGSVDYTVPGPGGAPVKRTVRVIYVERRIGGRWLMAATQYTGVPPSPPSLPSPPSPPPPR